MVCDASRSSESQENYPFHRIVWPGLYIGHGDMNTLLTCNLNHNDVIVGHCHSSNIRQDDIVNS